MSGVEFVAETPTSAQETPPPAPLHAESLLPAQPPRRQRLGRRSLTSRLVVGVVALVMLIVTITGTGTYFALRYFLNQRLDDQVQSTVGGNALGELFGVATVPDPGVAPTPVWAVALKTSGRLLANPNTNARWIHRLKLKASDAA